MTTRRRRSAPRSARAPRRATEWFDVIINMGTPVGGQDTINLSAAVLQDERKGMTLVRTILELDFLAITAGTGSLVSAGICMWPIEASSAGAFPDADQADYNPAWVWP